MENQTPKPIKFFVFKSQNTGKEIQVPVDLFFEADSEPLILNSMFGIYQFKRIGGVKAIKV